MIVSIFQESHLSFFGDFCLSIFLWISLIKFTCNVNVEIHRRTHTAMVQRLGARFWPISQSISFSKRGHGTCTIHFHQGIIGIFVRLTTYTISLLLLLFFTICKKVNELRHRFISLLSHRIFALLPLNGCD